MRHLTDLAKTMLQRLRNSKVFRKKKRSKRSSSRTELLRRMPKGGICAEIGVWKGDFSATIIEEAAPSKLYLVDPWAFAPHYPRRMYGGTKAADQAAMDAIANGVKQRFASNPHVVVYRSTSGAFFDSLDSGSLDWVYIDGDHSFQAVLDDLNAAWRTVREGGIVAGDDFNWKDSDDTFAVQLAVEKFCREKNVNFELLEGQFVIERLSAG